MDPACLDDVGLDDEVIPDEVGRIGAVSKDAANFGRCENDMLWFFLGEEGVDGTRIEEVELGAGAEQKVGVALVLERADDGRADETPVAGDVDAGVGFHVVRHRGLEEESGVWRWKAMAAVSSLNQTTACRGAEWMSVRFRVRCRHRSRVCGPGRRVGQLSGRRPPSREPTRRTRFSGSSPVRASP